MDKKNLRIVFMGTPEISKKVLEDLIHDGYQIVGLIAQPDRPKGRKKELLPVPTKEVALAYKIPVAQPIKIREDYEFLKEWNPDVIITLAYGQIVPQGVLDIPRYGAINLHGSLLPKYRGAAPIQYALIHHEKETGMSLMEMTFQMDAGRVYDVEKVTIDQEDNATSLFVKMGEAASRLILRALPLYIDGILKGEEQDETKVTFCPTIKKEQERLSLNLEKDDFLGWVRGLSYEPGGYILVEGQKWKILKAHPYDVSLGEVGKIEVLAKDTITLQLKDGRIALDEIQKEGKPKMKAKDFINGLHQKTLQAE
ncbi:methionyl-tRNA formyltransferase [Coprobacillus sp. CAG:826]|nr:methionyl-tRNA formyltransferase [Coprobacillus sp.]CDD93984.1 methionyl-tRNA formyltransferase [Coprobacillus sp. CAG:826]